MEGAACTSGRQGGGEEERERRPQWRSGEAGSSGGGGGVSGADAGERSRRSVRGAAGPARGGSRERGRGGSARCCRERGEEEGRGLPLAGRGEGGGGVVVERSSRRGRPWRGRRLLGVRARVGARKKKGPAGAPSNLINKCWNSVAHGPACATERQLFCGASACVRHRKLLFCGACCPMRHRKGWVGSNPAVGGGAHKFSVAHGCWCATESGNSVAHGFGMRHRILWRIAVGAPQNVISGARPL